MMTWTFSLPVSQRTSHQMGRQLKMHFRVEETGKLQWFKGQILNYDPTLQKPNCYFSKLFGYYSCMTILPMLINLKNTVVVNYLVEVTFTQPQWKVGQSW